MQLRILFRGQVPTRKHDHRQILELRSIAKLLEHFEARYVGQAQIEHCAVIAAVHQRLQSSGAGVDRIDVDILVP